MTISQLVFDPYSEAFFNDPYDIYRRLRTEAPVYHDDKYGFYALSRHEDVANALKDFETYSSSKGPDLEIVKREAGNELTVRMVIMMDPPEHRHMRSLVNKVFTPRAIAAQEGMVAEVIDDILSRVERSGFDIVEDFAALFPVEVITRMLGVPEEQRQNVRIWMDAAMERELGSYAMLPRGQEANIATGAMYYDLIQQRRKQPKDDMISKLITVTIEREDGTPSGLDDIEVAAFASLLGGAGAETVTKLVGNAAMTFSRFPDQWQILLDDRSKVPAAVEELLRYEAPAQYLVRYTLKDVHLHGTTIPAGNPVLLIVGSANRDGDAFTDPDAFDIERDRAQAQNIGLGYGVHSCLGAALARMESRIALTRMLDFMPCYEIDFEHCTRVHQAQTTGWARIPARVVT